MKKEELQEIIEKHEEETTEEVLEKTEKVEETKETATVSVKTKSKKLTREEIIEKAKKEHGVVWEMKCGVSEFITVPLSRKMYNEAIKVGQESQDDGIDAIVDSMIEEVLNQTIVYPIDWRSHMKSSLYLETISDEIMKLSGFSVETREL